jgi:hypothetical protein
MHLSMSFLDLSVFLHTGSEKLRGTQQAIGLQCDYVHHTVTLLCTAPGVQIEAVGEVEVC